VWGLRREEVAPIMPSPVFDADDRNLVLIAASAGTRSRGVARRQACLSHRADFGSALTTATLRTAIQPIAARYVAFVHPRERELAHVRQKHSSR